MKKMYNLTCTTFKLTIHLNTLFYNSSPYFSNDNNYTAIIARLIISERVRGIHEISNHNF